MFRQSMTRIKTSVYSALRMREDLNQYLENLGQPKPDTSADRAIIIAMFAIAGLLFFAAIMLGSYIAFGAP